MDKHTAAVELQSRRRAREGLLPFCEYTHPSWHTGAHHKAICAALERVERGECRRLMIFAPPRHGKSELASRRFPAWYLGRNPDKQILATSYNADLATDFGREVRNLIRDETYQNTFPELELAADSTAAGRWHTNHGGIYISTGVGGTLTGRGADIALIDDPLKNREEADSQRIRDSIWKWYTSTFYTRLMPNAAIVIMVTRWHEDDLAARALESEDWEVLSLPAITNEDTDHEAALWPDRYSLESLRHTRSVLPRRDWQALYQQQPTVEQGTYCQRSWFQDRYDEAPETLNRFVASDFAVTSGGEGVDPDWTEHGLFGIAPDDTLYVLDWWSGQTTSDQWIESLLDLIAKHKPHAWFGEAGVIRRAIEPFLRKRMQERKTYVRTEWMSPIKAKDVRGRAFQARASMGKVRFPKTAWADRVIDQCVAFPGATHDDAFDVMSIMCQAIDQAHPAIEKTQKPAVRDRWRRERTPEQAWRVV